ncbi:hypothetical protein GCM10007885_12800 [Methylobacterium gnaphalii]|nr:hypothetical protein GCM10007885_12800 [Methylobacterium gnaphalii]
MIELPDICVRLRECPPYGSMENMSATGIALDDGVIKLFYRSADSLFEIRFSLNFQDERLLFDVTQGVFLEDDGSVAAARHLIEIERFIRDYFLNGELQIWNALTDELLSRKDAYIPLNCFLDLDACNARIEHAKSELDRRIKSIDYQ